MWVKNEIIPFKGYKAIMLFGVVFYRGSLPSLTTIRHENIHKWQWIELMFITFFPLLVFDLWYLAPFSFYILYLLEYLIKTVITGRHAYRSISFEQEAFFEQSRHSYERAPLGWVKYLFKL